MTKSRYNILLIMVVFAIVICQDSLGMDYNFFSKVAISYKKNKIKEVNSAESIENKGFSNYSIAFGYDVKDFEVFANYEYNYFDEVYRMNNYLITLNVNRLFKNTTIFTPYIGSAFGINISRVKYTKNFTDRSNVINFKVGFETKMTDNLYLDENLVYEVFAGKLKDDFVSIKSYSYKFNIGLLYRF